METIACQPSVSTISDRNLGHLLRSYRYFDHDSRAINCWIFHSLSRRCDTRRCPCFSVQGQVVAWDPTSFFAWENRDDKPFDNWRGGPPSNWFQTKKSEKKKKCVGDHTRVDWEFAVGGVGVSLDPNAGEAGWWFGAGSAMGERTRARINLIWSLGTDHSLLCGDISKW